jgi:tetraacyldisaccharide 4'-kinase
VLSVGNLTVGGTGKTPIAAWAAGELERRGAAPAIVLRGYGGDEPLVHRRLNPSIPVVVDADRVRGVEAARELGADVAVLDDAFQHRRIARTADWVLVSADRWSERRRLLPAGPWRESLDALSRATAVIVTRKAATRDAADVVAGRIRRQAGAPAVAVAYLSLGDLRRVGADLSRPITDLRGSRVLLIAAIGDPAALRSQLEADGAIVDARAYGDHHAFTDEDVASLARDAEAAVIAVCTLKDAVKLGSRWPRAAPALWYVSQRVTIEDGTALLARSLDTVLEARIPA